MAHKEQLMYSKYEDPNDQKVKSLLIPGLLVDKENPDIFCPRCRARGQGLEHGEKVVCRCGLSLQRWGNCLEIS